MSKPLVQRINDVNLDLVRIVEPMLSRDRVDHYIAQGESLLLSSLNQRQELRVPVTDWGRENGQIYVLLSDFNHRIRALYELGTRNIELLMTDRSEGNTIDPLEDYPFLKDAPVLELPGYMEWHEEFRGYPLDLRD